MKKALFLLVILIPVISLITCGNEFLRSDFDPGNGSKNPTGNLPVSGTVEEDIPPGVAPIYIDTNEQLDALNWIGTVQDYPLDGYYILRGNGVVAYKNVNGVDIEERIFHARYMIGHPARPFSGVFTGWYKDEAKKTVVVLDQPLSAGLFPSIKGVLNKTKVSWLKIETAQDNAIGGVDLNGNLGIIAHQAENTLFEHVTVGGRIHVPEPASTGDPLPHLYVGGFVGQANTGTVFKNCYAGAGIVLEGGGANDFYAGGFAGRLAGQVHQDSAAGIPVVSGTAVSFSPISIHVKTTGTGYVYAGGIAGVLEGNSVISDASSNADVLAEGYGTSYAGGFAGSVRSGGITYNTSTGMLTVTANAAFGSGSGGLGESYAGGIAGMSTQTLDGNTLEGSLTVISKYYSTAGYAGGLVGKLVGPGAAVLSCSVATNSTRIIACSYENATAPQPGEAYAGGLVGFSDRGQIQWSSLKSQGARIYAGWSDMSGPSTNQVASEAYAGGLVGYTTGPVDKSYALAYRATSGAGSSIEARVTEPNIDATNIFYPPKPGSAYAGGIAGRADRGSGIYPTITESYAIATIKSVVSNSSLASMSGAIAGGIVGQTDSAISSAFAVADIYVGATDAAGRAQGGGIAGIYTNTTDIIEQTYAAGHINVFITNQDSTALAYAGGLLGQTANSSILGINNCVALQRYVASNAVQENHHQIIGNEVTTGATNFWYENMSKQATGPAGFPSSAPSGSQGYSITAIQAGVGANPPLAWYTSIVYWDVSNVWMSHSSTATYPFPVLKRLDHPPTLPSWAQIN